ncbi:MAG: PIN domain-containing protein [Armatimonadetes bacterium]|nr:PIN domain-containing protein [Armatimonadota bacterium]
MIAPHPVLLDADVLAQSLIGDFLIWTAHNTNLLRPRWTEQIWEEVLRTQVDRLGWDRGIAERRMRTAFEAFPEADIVGYEAAIVLCSNHPKDRHVLAAAISSGTDTILTFNLPTFRPRAQPLTELRPGIPVSIL